MAKQMSVITLKGNIGRLNFFENKDGFQAREKGGVSKNRIMTDPKFARVRENIAEFKTNAEGVKLLRTAMRPAVQKITDTKLHVRLVNKMMQILKSDPLNRRGERKVQEGDWSLLAGVELNSTTPLSQTLKIHVNPMDTPTDWGVSVPAFSPSDDVILAQGATHLRFFLAAVSVDFEAGTTTLVTSPSADIPVELASGPVDLSIPKSQVPNPHKVLVFGVEFLQIVNGENYPLLNSSNGAGMILSTERS
jgi:hypothetical protein